MSFLLSEVYRNRAADAWLGSGRAAGWPNQLLVHLYTGDPADQEVPGVELGPDGGYAPLAVVNDDTSFPPAVGGQKVSASFTIPFTGPASDEATWGVISDGVDLMLGGPLSETINPVGPGDVIFSIAVTFPDAPID